MLANDIDDIFIAGIQCSPEDSRFILYTEEVLNGTHYCMVFKLSDIDKFGDKAFNRFDIQDQINSLKQKTYSRVFSHHKWKVKFVKIIAFHGVEPGLSYMINDLANYYDEILVDNIYQLSTDMLRGGYNSKIHHIEYYDNYQLYNYDSYIEKYDSNYVSK